MSEPIDYARGHAAARRTPVLAIIAFACAAIGGVVPLAMWLYFEGAIRLNLGKLLWASILTLQRYRP